MTGALPPSPPLKGAGTLKKPAAANSLIANLKNDKKVCAEENVRFLCPSVQDRSAALSRTKRRL